MCFWINHVPVNIMDSFHFWLNTEPSDLWISLFRLDSVALDSAVQKSIGLFMLFGWSAICQSVSVAIVHSRFWASIREVSVSIHVSISTRSASVCCICPSVSTCSVSGIIRPSACPLVLSARSSINRRVIARSACRPSARPCGSPIG